MKRYGVKSTLRDYGNLLSSLPFVRTTLSRGFRLSLRAVEQLSRHSRGGFNERGGIR